MFNSLKQALLLSASFFKIKLNIFLDTLIQKIFFQIIKINNFRDDLTDISAKKEALLAAYAQETPPSELA